MSNIRPFQYSLGWLLGATTFCALAAAAVRGRGIDSIMAVFWIAGGLIAAWAGLRIGWWGFICAVPGCFVGAALGVGVILIAVPVRIDLLPPWFAVVGYAALGGMVGVIWLIAALATASCLLWWRAFVDTSEGIVAPRDAASAWPSERSVVWHMVGWAAVLLLGLSI